MQANQARPYFQMTATEEGLRVEGQQIQSRWLAESIGRLAEILFDSAKENGHTKEELANMCLSLLDMVASAYEDFIGETIGVTTGEEEE